MKFGQLSIKGKIGEPGPTCLSLAGASQSQPQWTPCCLLSTGKIFGQISSAKLQFCKTRANLSQEPVLVSHWTLLPPLGPLERKLGLGRDTGGLQHPLAKVYKPERIHFSLSQLVLLSNLNIWLPVKMSILFWDPCDTFVFSKYPQNLART